MPSNQHDNAGQERAWQCCAAVWEDVAWLLPSHPAMASSFFLASAASAVGAATRSGVGIEARW
jgi:hypothetical protein